MFTGLGQDTKQDTDQKWPRQAATCKLMIPKPKHDLKSGLPPLPWKEVASHKAKDGGNAAGLRHRLVGIEALALTSHIVTQCQLGQQNTGGLFRHSSH